VSVNTELFDDLDCAEADAGEALDRAAQPSLFARLAWFRLLQEHVRLPGQPLIVRARRGDRAAWLFLRRDGGKAVAWAAWYSLRAGPIGDPLLVPDLLRALRAAGIGEIELAPMEEKAGFVASCRAAGWRAFAEPATGNWRAQTGGLDFATYWEQRPKRVRNTAARKAKTAALTCEIFTRFDPAAWAAYEEVYRASWKPDEGAPAFLRALAAQEGEAGALRLGIARKEGRAVAAQLWLVENGEAVIHKLAYRDDAKALSPGTILSMAMFRHVLDEDKVGAIDYGTGDEPYKADWMDSRRTLWRVKAYDGRSLGGLLRSVGPAARQLARRLRSR
jgi:hypothetical protein